MYLFFYMALGFNDWDHQNHHVPRHINKETLNSYFCYTNRGEDVDPVAPDRSASRRACRLAKKNSVAKSNFTSHLGIQVWER
jgi:hypothetical protein